MRRTKGVLWGILGLALTLVILLTAVEIASFDLSGHMKLFDKYNISQETGLDQTSLREIMADILRYFKDDRVLLDTKIPGQNTPAFGERAVIHMVDVKDLFVGGRTIRNISLLIIPLLILYLRNDPLWIKGLAKTLLFAAGGSLMAIVLLAILMQLDFYQYFTYFHLLFFSNDLWILDPKTELMIKMLPEGFFMDTAYEIIYYFLAGNLLTGFLGGCLFLKHNRKEGHQ